MAFQSLKEISQFFLEVLECPLINHAWQHNEHADTAQSELATAPQERLRMPNTKTHEIMIYGAYGYSGALIAEQAVARGHRPILAGRNADKLRRVAEKLGLAWRVFGLDDIQNVADALHDVSLVIHCAGPFSATAAPMLHACIASGTHYLDITGEIAVFELARTLDAGAREAGIVLCPGTGFDVIPTDGIARILAEQLPDASELDLGFAGGRAISPGTAKTTIEAMAKGVAVRENGAIRYHRYGFLEREIDFGAGTRLATPIPWGDVSTAHASTGIPNIRVFIPVSPKALRRMRLLAALRPLFGMQVLQRILKRRVNAQVTGPDAATRADQRVLVWGEARNPAGDQVTARIETPNGYDITSWGPVLIAEHLLKSVDAKGYQTPSLLMGSDWLQNLPGMGRLQVEKRANEST